MKQTHEEISRLVASTNQLKLQRANATGETRVQLTRQIEQNKIQIKTLKTEFGVTSSKKHSGFA